MSIELSIIRDSYFYVCVHKRDKSKHCDQKGDKCLFDLPRNLKKPTFHHLRTQMNKMKVNPVMVGYSDWRFLLGNGYLVPLFEEEQWCIHRKDFNLFDGTEGTVRNPHRLCVTGNWNTAHQSPSSE